MINLRNELESLQRKLAWRICLQATLDAIILVALLLIPLIAIDHYFRPELSLIRHLLSIGFWIGLISVITIRVLPNWLRRPQLLDVAFAVEDTLEVEPGQIATTVNFEQLENNNIQGFKEPKSHSHPWVRLRTGSFIFKLFIVFAFSLTLVVQSPGSTLIAISRISNPNSQAKWPRFTKLAVYDQSETKISPGGILSQYGQENSTFYVIDEYGEPPSEIILQVRSGTQPLKQIRLRGEQERIDGAETTAVFPFRLLPNSDEDLQFRVIGGDDTSMPWTHLLKELKPAVQTLNCRISPPEYLILEESIIPNWTGRLQVPVGSELSFNLQLNRAVIEFRVQNQFEEIVFEQAKKADQIDFTISPPSTIDEQLQYELLVNVQGAASADQWVRVKRLLIETIVDQPPSVELVQPTTDRTITTDAVVPIQASSRDDYALNSFQIVIVGNEEFSLPADNLAANKEHEINGELTIALTNASQGDVIELHAEAKDFHPESQATVSNAIKLTLVSQEDKLSEVNSDLKQITKQISSNFSYMQNLKSMTIQSQESISQSPFLETAAEQVESLFEKQKQLLNRLSDPSLQKKIDAIREETNVNRIADSEVEASLQKIEQRYQNEVLSTSRKNLEELELLHRFVETLNEDALSEESLSHLATSLNSSLVHQLKALDLTGKLIAQLGHWIDNTDIQLQWNLIKSDLLTKLESLKTAARETISKSTEELTSDQKKRLQELASQHQQLANRITKFQRIFDQDSEWQLLGELLSYAKTDQLLQNAAAAILQNNILEAIEIDQQVSELFEDFDAQLIGQEFKSRTELIELLKAIRGKFEGLKTRQVGLNSKWRNENSPEILKEHQSQLMNDFSELVDEVDALGIGQVSEQSRSYFSGVESLLDSPENAERIFIEPVLQQIESSLEKIENGFEDALQRLTDRDRKEQLEELRRVAHKLRKGQEEGTAMFQILLESKRRNTRLSRRERRDLLEISRFEMQITEELEPFQSAFREESEIGPLLQACANQSRTLSDRLELGVITTAELSAMEELTQQLTELTQTTARPDSQQEELYNLKSEEFRTRLAELLQLQNDLIRDEEIFLLKSDNVRPSHQTEFIERQKQIDIQLKELFEEFNSE